MCCGKNAVPRQALVKNRVDVGFAPFAFLHLSLSIGYSTTILPTHSTLVLSIPDRYFFQNGH